MPKVLKKEKVEAIRLRKLGLPITQIAQELSVAKSSVSLWTQDIVLTDEQKNKINNEYSSRSINRSLYYLKKRQKAQEHGKKRIKNNDHLYVAGCMLYWAEGSKSVNGLIFSNSELSMLKLFKKFLNKYFNVNDDQITITIHAYTDIHTKEEIINYWIKNLEINKKCLRKCNFDNAPKSSKNLKIGKLEYGTCHLKVKKSTYILQEIFGAIQEYGKFTNNNWLNKNKISAGMV